MEDVMEEREEEDEEGGKRTVMSGSESKSNREGVHRRRRTLVASSRTIWGATPMPRMPVLQRESQHFALRSNEGQPARMSGLPTAASAQREKRRASNPKQTYEEHKNHHLKHTKLRTCNTCAHKYKRT